MSDPGHRRGMVFVDDDRDYLDETYDSLRKFATEDSGSSTSEDSDYADIHDMSDNASDDSSSFHSEGDDIAEYWDPYLYQLQLQAPKPNLIPCSHELPDRPPYYGEEYHGAITRDETARLLGTHDGNYLVRRGLSHAGTYSLSFVFDGHVRHYRLYFDGHDHLVGEKPFESVEDLVQDGLITLYMEANNVEEYLQSARETRSMRRRMATPPDATNLDQPSDENTLINHCSSDEAVYSGDGEGVSPPYSSAQNPPSLPPRPAKHPTSYQPCTIPQKRASISQHTAAHRLSRVSRIYEEIPEDQKRPSARKRGSKRESRSSMILTSDGRHLKDSSLYFHYEKPHNFKLHNYMGLSWCDFCRNFMWGLRNQGYRCKDCGYNAHKECKDDVASDCHPSRQLVKRVYGVELTTLVKMHSTKVPVVVKECVEEIERRGLEVEGLYRVSGKANDILRIKKQFDNDSYADLANNEDIHAISGALKLYMRELPVPVMTFDAYDICLIAARSSSVGESIDMLRVALKRLPPAHYNTLRHLLRHLHRVQRSKSINKMDCRNLAVVFAPTILRSPYNHSEIMAMQKLPEQKKAMELLIEYYPILFQ